MANDTESEDRLTKTEFAELIQHLSVQEILIIEYRIGSNWSKLFSRKNAATHTFYCNLCALETSSFKNLIAHIDGKRHKFQMEKVKQLYHPVYTYPKSNKKDGNSRKHNENSALNSTSTKEVLSSNQQPDNVEQRIQNEEKNKTKSMSNNPDEPQSNIGEEKLQNIEKSKTQMRNTNKQASVANDKQQSIEKTKPEVGVKEKLQNNEKNDADNIKAVSENEEMNMDDCAIIDDSNEKSKSSAVNENQKGTEKAPESKKIPVVLNEKRPLPKNSCERKADLKKRKIVINPAAVSLSSTKAKNDKNKESHETPNYQTNRVIIPTVHKNKSDTTAPLPLSSQGQSSKDLPKFSVKSYSSNPSDNDVYGILGVEYVIKILKNNNDISPRYECGLCELVFDGFAMQKHLEGYNHRLKFCEKHFPTAIRHYRQYMEAVPEHEVFKVMAPVLAKLAIAIEQHHGRSFPYECYERDFSLNRHEILGKAFSYRHASEQCGPTFTHVVGSNEIDEFINNRHNYKPQSFSRAAIFDRKCGDSSSKFNSRHQTSRHTNKESDMRNRHQYVVRENSSSDRITDRTYKPYMPMPMPSGLTGDGYALSYYQYNQAGHTTNSTAPHIDDVTYNLMVDDFIKGTLKGVSRNSPLRDQRKRSLSPARNWNVDKRKSLSPLRHDDIWQAYRHMVDQELYNLDERFKLYREDPERHPSYNEEWQTFWKRRKDALVSSGVDHRNYNYQSDWVKFIKTRIEELYAQEAESLKMKSRERLCLPLTNGNLLDIKYHVQGTNMSSSNELLPKVSHPQNMEPPPTMSNPSTMIQNSNNGGTQVVPVLRLMTALEDSLGSLGPKIIDLLSKALQTEKLNPSYVNAIILNEENCSLIETAKEKLKGFIITGLFEGSKKRILDQVVNEAEQLLEYAYQFKQQLASQRSLINNSSLSSDTASNTHKNQHHQSSKSHSSVKKAHSSTKHENSLSRIDKKELASKLAASLVAQGKTDFDSQQLQQLIAVYKLIEKKKRENPETIQFNRSDSFHDVTTSTKKTLSDTLSDLLKSSSSSSDVTNNFKTSNSSGSTNLNQITTDIQCSSTTSGFLGNYASSNSFGNDFQSSSDNYFNSAAQSVYNSFSANGGGGGGSDRMNRESSYGVNYSSNLVSNPQTSNMSNMYNNPQQQQYHNNNSNNNGMSQNWGWTSNMETNQNYSVHGPGTNFNRNYNSQRF